MSEAKRVVEGEKKKGDLPGVDQMRALVECGTCGAIGYSTETYCVCCGTARTASPLSCGSCGRTIEHSRANYCPHCGERWKAG